MVILVVHCNALHHKNHKICRENQNTCFIFNNFFFRISRRLRDNVEKYCTAGQATDDNIAHAFCMLETDGYKRTLRTCNIYCFSTATMVARTTLIVALYKVVQI